MRFLEKLKAKQRRMNEELNKLRAESIQKRDQKRRDKREKVKRMKWGPKKIILDGLAMRKSPLDVMREAHEYYKAKELERDNK